MEIKQICERLDDLESQLAFLIETILHLMKRNTKMAATVQDITAEMELQKTKIAAEKAEVQVKLDEMTAKIAALEAGIGGIPVGSVVTQAELDNLFALSKEITAGVEGIYNATGVTPVANPYPTYPA